MTDSPMTEAQLAEIEARTNAATAGNWRTSGDTALVDVVVEESNGTTQIFTTDVAGYSPGFIPAEEMEANAEFAAHARSDVPRLIAEVRTLRARVASRDETLGVVTNALDAMKEAYGALLNREKEQAERIEGLVERNVSLGRSLGLASEEHDRFIAASTSLRLPVRAIEDVPSLHGAVTEHFARRSRKLDHVCVICGAPFQSQQPQAKYCYTKTPRCQDVAKTQRKAVTLAKGQS